VQWQTDNQCIRLPLINQAGDCIPVRFAVPGLRRANSGGGSCDLLSNGYTDTLLPEVESKHDLPHAGVIASLCHYSGMPGIA
jgi:hypothetical protein